MQPQHCGLCSALTQLLRRAMCLGTSPGSRRGSSGDDSSCYYHRHDVQLLSSSNAAAAEAEGDRDDVSSRGGGHVTCNLLKGNLPRIPLCVFNVSLPLSSGPTPAVCVRISRLLGRAAAAGVTVTD